MCGIIGLLHFEKQRPVDEVVLKSMTDIIEHRGPDGEDFFVENEIGLGHRSLSIIDLSSRYQPMFSDDKQKVTVFMEKYITIFNYVKN